MRMQQEQVVGEVAAWLAEALRWYQKAADQRYADAQYNIGDAGLIAYFSDGNGTHADWKSEVFYIAPLDDPACVRVTAMGRDSSFCNQARIPECQTKLAGNMCKALHFQGS